MGRAEKQADAGGLSREQRLLQAAHRRAREAGEEAARLAALIARREREGWQAAQGEIDALRATVARRERTLAVEQHRAARDLAAHDRDRRIAQRQLRVAEGALHAALHHGWLGAEEARAALDEIAAVAVSEQELARLG